MSTAKRRSGFFGLAVLLGLFAVLLPPGESKAGPECTVTTGDSAEFKYIGPEIQTIQVPPGVDKATVTVNGAFGGQAETTAAGGKAGVVEATLEMTPGDCLDVYVAGWGGGSRWGFAYGGERAVQDGPGKDSYGGGGGSAIALNDKPLAVGGGGGGGAGNGSVLFNGGAGGDGAGGAGPGTPNGGDGGNGQGVPVSYYVNLGGRGGFQSEHDGQDGVFAGDLFAGAGGGGGGGMNGGEGGGGWYGTSWVPSTKPVGGGGGGGGDSYAAPSAEDVQFTVDGRNCPSGGQSECNGVVTIDWVEHPTKVAAYAGEGQSTPVTGRFPRALEARVTALSGDPVAGEEVTFELPQQGASASFLTDGSPTRFTATTDQNGIATSPHFRANGTAGNWTAEAQAAEISRPATFPQANEPAATKTVLYSAPEPSGAGESVVFTAVVGAAPSSANPPQGSVDFELDGEILGVPVAVSSDGVAFSEPVPLKAGKHEVSATFNGTAAYQTSGDQITHQVNPAPVMVTLESSRNPAAEGPTVEFTAGISPVPPATGDPTGKVQFTVDGENHGPAVKVESGVAASGIEFTEAGAHIVRAIYSGDQEFAPGNASVVQSIGDEATAVSLASSAATAVYGDPLNLTATVTGALPPSGTVSFTATGSEVGEFELCPSVTLVSGQAECAVDPSLAAGEYEIDAAFTPDVLGVDPSQGKSIQIIQPAKSSVGVEAVPDPLTFGQRFGANATVGTLAIGPVDLFGQVQFSFDGSNLGNPVPLEGDQAEIPADSTPLPGAGAHAVEASYSGDRNLRPSRSATVVAVEPAETQTVLKSSRNPSAARTGVKLTATVSSADASSRPPDGTVQFWADGGDRGKPVPIADGKASGTINGLRPGQHDIRVYYSSPDDFAPSEDRLTQTVDSPPPDPKGIYPCGKYRVVLTAAYQRGNVLRFEGAARESMRGKRVHIRSRGKALARTTVRADGTFWAVSRMPDVRRPALTRYRAIVNGHSSRSRQLRQPIEIVSRSPRGAARKGKPHLLMRRFATGRSPLFLGRQQRCRITSVKRIRRIKPNRRGLFRVGLTRPRTAEPFAVYRLMTRDGRTTSSPILIRPRG